MHQGQPSTTDKAACLLWEHQKGRPCIAYEAVTRATYSTCTMGRGLQQERVAAAQRTQQQRGTCSSCLRDKRNKA